MPWMESHLIDEQHKFIALLLNGRIARAVPRVRHFPQAPGAAGPPAELAGTGYSFREAYGFPTSNLITAAADAATAHAGVGEYAGTVLSSRNDQEDLSPGPAHPRGFETRAPAGNPSTLTRLIEDVPESFDLTTKLGVNSSQQE